MSNPLPNAAGTCTTLEDCSHPGVAVAILYQPADAPEQPCQFLLQLRDDKPQIAYPGCWAFFGGHQETDEPPLAAIQRELGEEIGYRPTQIRHFRSYSTYSQARQGQVIRHVFWAPLVVDLKELRLSEGQDLGLSTIEEVQQGQRFSVRLGQNRPLAQPHRQILLDFFQRHRDQLCPTG